MSTPTEAHLDLALQIAEALARSGNVAAAELIADNEARETLELRSALALGPENCDEAYDELRLDCDELRADVVRLTARAERAEAAETVALANWNGALANWNGALERTMKADAELATERARLDWFHEAAGDRIWVANQDIRAAIDAAMKKDVPINSPLDARP